MMSHPDSRFFSVKDWEIQEHNKLKPTQAEMTLSLKDILEGILTSIPTLEMGIYG